jgi:hypothetical protein
MMAHFGWEQDPWQQLKVSLEPKEPFKALASSLASQRELIAAFMMQNQARARALLTDLCSQMTLRPSQRNTKTDDGESKPALKESLERLRQMNIRPPYLPDEIPEDQHESVFAETKRRILDALANPLTKLTYRVMVKDDSAQETQGHLKVALEVPKVDTGLQ